MQNNNVDLLKNKIAELNSKIQLLESKLNFVEKEKNDYHEIIENANSAIFKISEDDIIVYLNDFAKTLFKKECSNNLIGKKFSQSVNNLNFDQSENINYFLNKLPYKPKTFEIFESKNINQQGNIIWLSWTIKPTFEKDLYKGFIAVGNDITKRKMADEQILIQKQEIETKNSKLTNINNALSLSNKEIVSTSKELIKSELRFRNMSESILFGVFIAGPNGKNEYVNYQYCELTGMDAHDALGSGWFQAIHPNDLEFVKQKWTEAIKNKEFKFDYFYRLQNVKTKEILKVHAIAKKMTHKNELIGYVGVIEDITQQEKLINKLKNYELIIKNSVEMMSLISNKFEYLAVNDAYVEAHGLSKEKIEGSTFFDIWGQEIYDEKVKERFEAAFSGKLVRYQEWFNFKKAGRKFMDVIYQPVYNEENKVESVAVNTLDITKLKEFENRLKKAKSEAERANRAKSEFLANMSHEIRTPLNAVIGFTELLENQIKNTKQKQYLKSIKAGGRSLLAIINDILDLSKIEAAKIELKFEAFKLKSIVDEINQIFSIKIDEKNLKYESQIDENLPKYIYLDEIRLRQILYNLIGNAIKFTEKGFVKLHVKLIQIIGKYADIQIVVEDSGIGIPKNQYEEIFTAFKQQAGQSTRKYGGTGLGLTISKKLIEAMGGTIELESIENKYSKFTINFPKVKTSDKIYDKTGISIKNEYKIEFEEAKIIVIDNIELNRNLIIENFVNSKIEVFDTEYSEKTIDLIKKVSPNLILIDINKQNINCCKILDFLKIYLTQNNIPIIALSTAIFTEKDYPADFKFSGFLSKPIGQKELLDLLSKHLKHKKLILRKYSKSKTQKLKIQENIFTKEDFEKIKDTLEQKFLQDWKKVIRDELSDDIEKFTIELDFFAKTFHLNNFIDYSKNLAEQLSSFDFEEMAKSLNLFPEIVSSFLKNKTD
ncbi:MAG: PAS domain S-box protein [Bacteroidales bacterium]|nr:PAS domain S-box protein [Bacteroidales bacterium]MBN2757126.1 PAS domain S-box protein [Bacteroidales bacterium]